MYLFVFLTFFSFCFSNNYVTLVDNPEVEKPLVVLVCSYNNEKLYQGNLDSIFSQNYSNYRVVYINDCSTDKTGELVQEYFKDHGVEDKVTYIQNKKNYNPMRNQYFAIHDCKDEEIIVIVDGDDQLYGTEVFQTVNKAFCNEDVWFTYGQDTQHISKPTPKRILRSARHRSCDFRWSHLRCFYAGLFKQIPRERFSISKTKFFPAGADISVMLNLMDLARDHTFFIDQELYKYNDHSPLNEGATKRRKQVRFCNKAFRQKPLPFYCRRKSDFIKN